MKDNHNYLFPERKGSDCSKYDNLRERFGRDDILPMWVADADYSAPPAVVEAIRRRAEHPVYGYTIYSERFFDAIVKWYERNFSYPLHRKWIVPAHGVVLSINLCIEAYTKRGDGIIVQTPIYPPFISSVKRHGRKVLENRLLYERGRYSIDFDDLEKKASKARMLLLCSPHNPSTRAFDEEELRAIVDVAVRHGLLIVSDEIHSDLVFEKRHIPIAKLEGAGDISVTLHAPSKTFNIAGLNISYAIIENDSLRRAYVLQQEKAGFDNGNCFGIEALTAAYEKGDEWLREVRRLVRKNMMKVIEFFREREYGIEAVIPEATFLLWLDCRATGMDDEELQDFFTNKALIALNSGISFTKAGSGFMRLNVGTSEEMVDEALRRIEKAFGKYGRR
jgi:cystathionine beta-lyase